VVRATGEIDVRLGLVGIQAWRELMQRTKTLFADLAAFEGHIEL
jgi:hypothetical protein